MDSNVAENINTLANFLGTRDIDALNQEELFRLNRYIGDMLIYSTLMMSI